MYDEFDDFLGFDDDDMAECVSCGRWYCRCCGCDCWFEQTSFEYKKVVLEGPKGTGKSTVSKRFIEEEDYVYYHSSSETENDLKYHLDLLKLDNNQVIIDRFSLGEIIYPEITKGRKSKLTKEEFNETFNFDGVVYVILYASDIQLLKDRVLNRGKSFTEEEFQLIEDSNKAFEKYGKELQNGKNIVCIDVCENDSNDIYYKILDMMEE